MPKISVLMPCLNMEKYIGECLASVCGQTLDDIEILVIDAGSTDRTLAIVREMQESDARIRLIASDKKSYGYQMNLGVAEARGEYISIVETDDYIERDALAVLYENIQGTDADYIKGTAESFFEMDGYYRLNAWMPFWLLADQKKISICPCAYPIIFFADNFLWTGIYRADLLKGIRFHETPGAAFQDISVLFQIYYKSKRGIYIDKLVYHYRQDNGGASSYNPKGLDFVRYEYSKLLEHLSELEPAWQHILYYKLTTHTLNRYEFMAFGDYWEATEDTYAWLKEKIEDGLRAGLICPTEFVTKGVNCLELFLSDGHRIYDYWKQIYQRTDEKIQGMQQKLASQEVYIFGSGKRGKRTADVLRLIGVRIAGFCDNDVKKQGKTLYGIPIMSLEQSRAQSPKAFYIVANLKHDKDIEKQLLAAGVSKDCISMKYEQWRMETSPLLAYVQQHGNPFDKGKEKGNGEIA